MSARHASTAADAALAAGVKVPAVQSRYGIKGPDAAAWLQQHGIAVPEAPNHAVHWPAGDQFGAGRCLRLGSTEFLIEEDSAVAAPRTPPSFPDRAWLLLRRDASLLLDGPAWPGELAQVCSFDFERLRDEPGLVVMTLLAGIGVTLVSEPTLDDRLALRLWCDPSYASWLQDTLQHIALPAPPSPGDSR